LRNPRPLIIEILFDQKQQRFAGLGKALCCKKEVKQGE